MPARITPSVQSSSHTPVEKEVMCKQNQPISTKRMPKPHREVCGLTVKDFPTLILPLVLGVFTVVISSN